MGDPQTILSGRIVSLQAPVPAVNGLLPGFLVAVEDSVNQWTKAGVQPNPYVNRGEQTWVMTPPGTKWPEFHVGACVNVVGKTIGFSCPPTGGGIGDCTGYGADTVEQYDIP